MAYKPIFAPSRLCHFAFEFGYAKSLKKYQALLKLKFLYDRRQINQSLERMYKVFLSLFISILAVHPTSSISAAVQMENPAAQKDWENHLQNLLKRHGLLLNQVIEAAYYNKSTSDIDAIKQKLFTNAHDLATLFSSFLGDQAGEAFEPLFDEHIKLGGEYINASKQNLATKQQIAKQALENGDQIAALFSKWFPTISNAEWRKMLAEHVNLEAKQADAYFNNDLKQGEAIKDQSLVQLSQIGTLLIQGISNR